MNHESKLAPERERPFDDVIEITAPPMSFLELLWSDYVANRNARPEPLWKSIVLYPLRVLINPSMLFAFLVRCAQKGPPAIQYIIRPLQIYLFSSEVYSFGGEDGIVLGPGVSWPHPYGILIGRSAKIGAGVTIYNNVNVGANRHVPVGGMVSNGAHVGDRAVLYGHAILCGPLNVCQDATVGISVWLEEHVPPGALHTRHQVRPAGEWPGEPRNYYRVPPEKLRRSESASG